MYLNNENDVKTQTIKIKSDKKKFTEFSLWDPQNDRFFPISKRKTILGKSDKSDIIFDYPTVSRIHCECYVVGNKLKINDLNSRNGIIIKNKKVKTAVLDLETVFLLGDNPLVFVEGLGKVCNYGTIKTRNIKYCKMLEFLKSFSQKDINLLLIGESGSGKELVAKFVKEHSQRKNFPFIAVNCGAIPSNLFESELFGYVKGAFTGATREKNGLVKEAEHGILFLDEIAELKPFHQAALLRFLENGTYRQVGSTVEQKSNVRIIAATHKDLKDEVENGKFRLDLYYRFAGINHILIPLRDRKEDFPLLLKQFGNFNLISKEDWTLILSRKWEGNVRELKSFVVKSEIFGWKEILLQNNLNMNLHNNKFSNINENFENNNKFNKFLKIERDICLKTLFETKGNVSTASKLLGIPRTSLISKMKKLKIQKSDYVF